MGGSAEVKFDRDSSTPASQACQLAQALTDMLKGAKRRADKLPQAAC